MCTGERGSHKYTWGDILAQVRAPVLMLHGEADTTAPVQRARTTDRLLLERGKQSELVVYQGTEYEFTKVGDPFYNAAALRTPRQEPSPF